MLGFKKYYSSDDDYSSEPQKQVARRRSIQPGKIKVADSLIREQLSFHGLTEEKLGIIATYSSAISNVTDLLVDHFYAHILKFPKTKEILLKYSSVERQRPMLTRYVKSMFTGTIDDQFIEYRKKVGVAHDNIDLDANYYVAMYEIIKNILFEEVEKTGTAPSEQREFERAFSCLVQVDISLVSDALMKSRLKKIQKLAEKNNSLEALIAETTGLVNRASQGELKHRVDSSKYEGESKKLIEAINKLLDAIVIPISEATQILERMAKRDLTARVTGDYKGDFTSIKNSLNQMGKNLEMTLGQVYVAIEQVSEGAGQVSDSSQSLSDGATEQASSLEEIGSSITEMTAQTKQNAENAAQANTLSDEARKNADDGNSQMQRMLDAMGEINQSSSEISKIIKVIEEIAFQTNLLALNAAVEAARAGVHGKGFAVVAEEVRNLAGRSAKAARETTEMIEGSIKKVENGSAIAKETAETLGEIVNAITKVSDLVGEISSASNEQAHGIDEISKALGQIDNITQSNAANAEESAASAEELSGQSDQLRRMISLFRISNLQRRSMRPTLKRPQPAPGRQFHAGPQKRHSTPKSPPPGNVVNPNDVINLDDNDFGSF